MRNTLKKAFAAVLAAVLCLSFAGCYDENNTWAAKKGEDTLPIGAYIYYLNNAYSEAVAKVPTDTEVLKATIEDQDAKTWVEERGTNYLKSYYYIADKFDELGLELTEDEEASIASTTDTMWSYYKSALEPMGIAKESFHLASSLYNIKYQKVMQAMYTEGGEQAVPDEELESYFTENYYSYEYFIVSLSKTDDEGQSVNMTEEEKKAAKDAVEDYVKQINAGTLSVSEAASEYAEQNLGSADNTTYQAPSPTKGEYMNATILEALEDAEENTAVYAEDSTRYYVVRRLPIADAFTSTKEDENSLFGLISDMKSEEFSDYVMEQAKKVEGVEINQRALNTVSLSKFISDSNKNGTSSAVSESSEASSEAESTASSEAE